MVAKLGYEPTLPHMENPPEMAAKYLNTAYFIQEHSLNRGVRRNTFIIFNFFLLNVWRHYKRQHYYVFNNF